MNAALLTARGLTAGHRAPVLRDVAFVVHPGESWFVLGDNGAGKTTLLATLLGLLPPLAGAVAAAPAIADRSALGFVPQEARFGRSLPIAVHEFVGLGLQAGLARAERRSRVAAALQTMGLAARATAVLGELSLGQRRRALVARALARRPQLLVLDEPTANLDPRASTELAAVLEQQRLEHGLAIVHVCHDHELARRFATHVAWIAAGVCRCGSAAELLATIVAAGGA